MTDSPLQEVLAQRNKPLAEETAKLVQEIQPLLWHTLSTFPSGTSHTPEHTATVEKIASMVIPTEIINQLNDDELQLLILGCHYHDLGMAGTEAESSTHEAQDQARKDHAIRIGERLKEKWRDLGFRDEALAEALAEVCRGHRPPKENGVASWSSIRKSAVIGPDRSARLRLVSALLYVADELHIGADRASEKEEDWLEISNDESRRHWKRHQSIKGPALIDGHLRFEVSPQTIILESDLRKQVLKKAFSAHRDGQALLQEEGIQHKLTPISLTWNREVLWTLLLICQLSDMLPRTREQIRDALYDRYDSEAEKFIDLSALARCESSTREHLLSEIDRVIEHFYCRRYLKAQDEDQPDELVLNTELATAKRFFKTTKEADELDVLFKGRYAAHYDFDLHSSAFGVRHSELSIEPLVKSSYGIEVAHDEETPLSVLLKSSPTARHLAIEGAPAPSVLAKPHALALAVLSGASLDLIRAPELMLNQQFRAAYKALSATVTNEQAKYTDFVEELALVDGYTFEQLQQAVVPSKEATDAFNASVTRDGTPIKGDTEFTITQQIPQELRPIAVSLPHLYLAGKRAKTTVQILNTEEAPITVEKKGEEESEAKFELTSIAFGPGKPLIPETFAQRADFTVNESNRQLLITICSPVQKELNREKPLLMHFNTGQLISSTSTTVKSSFYFPALTAHHWRCFAAINRLRDKGNVSVVVNTEGDKGIIKGRAETLDADQLRTWSVEVADPDFVDFLHSKGVSTQFPWWCPSDVRNAIDSRNKEEWEAVYDKYLKIDLAEKRVVASVFLRMANEDGREYQEEYLGLFPDFDMNPPQVGDDSSMTQEEVNKFWDEGEGDCMLGSSFSSDEHELAQMIRDWFEDQSQDFPFRISEEPPDTPVFWSRIEIVRAPKVDRFWYVERPFIFRFRPINDEERWNVEGSYWESKGDQDREAIIQERLSALRTEKEATEQPKTLDQKTPQRTTHSKKQEAETC